MAVSSGIALEVHYCMGKQAGVDFFGHHNKKCGNCGMKEKKGCCHDEHKFYKISDSHKNVQQDTGVEGWIQNICTQYAVYQWQLPLSVIKAFAANHSPPDYNWPSINIRNCVFRI